MSSFRTKDTSLRRQIISVAVVFGVQWAAWGVTNPEVTVEVDTGVWKQRKALARGVVEEQIIQTESTEIISRDRSGRRLRRRTIHRVFQQADQNSFFDRDLKSLVARVPAGIVYLWSPRMPLSL